VSDSNDPLNELSEDADNNRVYWHSRRGMLEIDILLMPYAKEHYPSASAETKRKYKFLLSCEDQDIFAWFMGHAQPEDPELVEIVAEVKSKHGSN